MLRWLGPAFSGVHDPGHTILRRALRVALVLPIGYVLATVVFDLGTGGVFAAFGCFALMVFADFGGPLGRRFRAYLVTGVVGALTISLGTLVSFSVPLAVLVTFVVGFLVTYLSVLRGYVAGGGPAVQLAFVVAVTMRAPLGELHLQLAGWGLAVLLVAPASIVLWPGERRPVLRRSLARALRAAADVVVLHWAQGSTVRARAALADLDDAVAGVRTDYGGKPFRPAGATSRDRALMTLVGEVSRAKVFLTWALDDPRFSATGASTPGDADLAEHSADCLRRCADALEERGEPPSALELDARRMQHRAHSVAWVDAGLAAGAAPDSIVDPLERAYPLRLVSVLTTLVAQDVGEALGRPEQGTLENPHEGPRSSWTALRTQASLASPWMRNALRNGLGLALAVLVALVTGIEHGFWVVLGVLGIMRFDVLGTGRTALQAIWGTGLGFVVGSVVVLLFSDAPVVLWVLFPLTAFLAGWAPAATTFLLGQASFTVFVVVLFGLYDYPPELSTGVVRVIDVAMGAVVALVVGFLVYPRGVAGQLRSSVAASVDAANDYLVAAIDGLLGRRSLESVEAVAHTSRVADAVAHEAFDLSLMQRGPGTAHISEWTRLVSDAGHIVACSGLIVQLARLGFLPSACPGALDAMDDGIGQVHDRLSSLAAVLRTGVAPADVVASPVGTTAGEAPPGDPLPRMRICAADCILQAERPGQQDRGRGVVAVVWSHDWLVHLDWVARRGQSHALQVTTS